MKIRLAAKKDAAEVAKTIKRHSQTDYMGYVTFGEGYITEKMKKNNFYFVAEEKGEIVGCVRATIVDLDLAEIRTLCVDEGHREQGVATQLLETSLRFLKKKKMRKVVARSKPDNIAAISLFKKFGFVQEGYFREHYRKGIDVVQMAKFLQGGCPSPASAKSSSASTGAS